MKTLLSVLLLAPFTAFAQEIVDGPYIYYQQDSALIKTISQQEDLYKPVVKQVAVAALNTTVITVNVPGNAGWTFTTHIQPHITSPDVSYPAPEKMYLLSDIEGEFAAGRQLLIAGKVIDENYNWIFGKGHLVIAGDLFDRGKEVLPWLWLLYSLEEKAKAAGGMVHVILGNHDIMQLSGDFRYTEAAYFKNAWLMGRELRNVFGEDAELGRWLRSKNIIEKIGSVLVMHAGLSPEITRKGMSLQSINETCRPYYATARKDRPESVKSFFDANSPFWYRGYFTAPKATKEQVDSSLQLYNCNTIVVGHTITDTSLVVLYDGKVIGIDVNEHEGHHAALLIENGQFYAVDEKGRRKLIP
ncbi:Calcineurin-like phosphoesterase [Filimonas lacunae]|uniref:Calcineurin-like phosphoesterase n=1 Tax=Filimonas lacunae TaxID=477680 RepID=A0A173M9X8_9BACT|nr:metallophosphoesterase [Filimonas lacunae]BAV04354.1 protein-tyrosine-phosphatase [Filimonas lacunae]SIT31112.1 Calcineurin-like phosphoesterase [Filimonas lacunae]